MPTNDHDTTRRGSGLGPGGRDKGGRAHFKEEHTKPPQHVLDVCKIGQGHETCRYVTMYKTGWKCGKVDPKVRALLDEPTRRARFIAQGDNCDGVDHLNDMPPREDER